jgi:pimeloyl-ACP methyl ester carboxylesterase
MAMRKGEPKSCRRSRSAGPRYWRKSRRRWPGLAIASITLGFLGSGCEMIQNVRGVETQLALTRDLARVEGLIDVAGGATGTLVVVIGRPDDDGSGQITGVDSYVRVRAGSYAFPVNPGRYVIGAYEDRNRNGLLDPGELVKKLTDGQEFDLGAGEVKSVDIHLTASDVAPELTEAVNVFEILARSLEEQSEYSLWAWSKMGALRSDLEHEEFGPKAGVRGLWKFRDFLNEGLAGIYFLEAYDPDRIPVLFVHGLAGYPQEFSALIADLDRELFQPWFYFYPSGYKIDGMSTHLSVLLSRVQVENDFDELAIVAHSMGGLVSLGAILKYQEETHREDIRLLVSISTPWNGDPKAGNAAESRIELPPSLSDMSPMSDYLRWIFWKDEEKTEPRELADETDFHMIIGYKMRRSGTAANDGKVSVSSQARVEALDRAASRWPYDYDHRDILSAPEVIDRVDQILSDRFD